MSTKYRRRPPLRRFLSCLWLIGCCVSLTSCASINNEMQSWVGHHKHELIVAWGPPHSERQDGAGGEVLIYQYQHSLNGKDYYWATRMFYVNADGIIYRWRWEGL